MEESIRLLKNKSLQVSQDLIKYIDKNISLKDFLVLIYLDNSKTTSFNCEEIAKTLGLTTTEVLQSFNNLMELNYITMDTGSDEDGKINEKISLDNIYQITAQGLANEQKKKESNSIYEIFERELGRPISPTEYELINGWLSMDTTEELIIGALKEAVYNGAKSFRYIDRILFEWNKKGYRKMEDVNKSLRTVEENKNIEFFEYDWLNDDE